MAVAKVDGYDGLLTGFSQGDNFHSEDHLISQINALKINNPKITELYSERQPCSACQSRLSGYLADNVSVTYSVPWSDNADQNAAANAFLAHLIRINSYY